MEFFWFFADLRDEVDSRPASPVRLELRDNNQQEADRWLRARVSPSLGAGRATR